MTCHGNERPTEIVRHRLDEASLPTPGWPFQHDGELLAEGCPEDLRLIPNLEIERRRTVIHRVSPVDPQSVLGASGPRRSLSLELRRCECGTKQRTNGARQLIHRRKDGVGRRPEDPAERSRVGGRTDAKAQATDASLSSFRQRPTGVRFAIGGFVAVVIGKPIGQDNQQLPTRAALTLQRARSMANRRPKPGESTRNQSTQRTLCEWRESPSNRFTGMTDTAERPCERNP